VARAGDEGPPREDAREGTEIVGRKNRVITPLALRKRAPPHVCTVTRRDGKVRRLLSIVGQQRLPRVLRRMLDEEEFLSPYGIRSLSRFHREHPYIFNVDGHEHRVDYEPAESTGGQFGGNSNWRGPVWLPLNFLLVESLQKFHYYFGDEFKVEFPSGSGKHVSLWDVACDLSRRLNRIFVRDASGRRPVCGELEKFQSDPHWRDLIQFHARIG